MIYLDNAATTWPKPESVYKAMDEFARLWGANPGRGCHKMAKEAEKCLVETRELLAAFFNAPELDKVIFTFNTTDALNMAIKGFLRPGDHVITTGYEHNSMVRPLRSMESKGVSISAVTGNAEGLIHAGDIEPLLRSETRLAAMAHASNVIGAIQDIRGISALLKKHGIAFLVDAAQTAGCIPIDMEELGIDMLAFPGHKSLLGPTGTGGLILGKTIDLEPFREGGTGTKSEEYGQPAEYPLRLESGTHNTFGIAGLREGLRFIMSKGLDEIRHREEKLTDRLVAELADRPDITIYGPRNVSERAALVSFNINGIEPSAIAGFFEERHAIGGRAGLHCAPAAHESLGTIRFGGAMRLSPGYFTTDDEIRTAIKAVNDLVILKS